MRTFLRQKRVKDPDADIDMVPIMNMFMVLIPFLLSSASFFDINAIHTSVPVSQTKVDEGRSKANTDKTIIPVIEIQGKKIEMYALSDNLEDKELVKWDMSFTKEGAHFPLEKMQIYLQDMKKRYPKSDTIIVIPDDKILYETIIQTMDIARNSEPNPLFPNVVLSDKI